MLRGLAAVALVWAAAAVVQGVLLFADLRAGVDAVDEAETFSSPSDVLAGRPEAALDKARDRFDAARRRSSGLSLLPARYLPVLGRQLRSVAALSSAGRDISAVGIDALADARHALDQPEFVGAQRVELLRTLSGIARGAHARLSDVDLGPSDALLGPVDSRRRAMAERLARATDGLARGAEIADSAATLLAGPSRYLLLAANNAEMRAGSGAFLTAGTLDVADGEISLGDLEQTANLLLATGVPIEGDLAANWGSLEPNREWRNLGLTPRFDVNAELAARMWAAATGQPVDGVLALDVATLQAVLGATGPVEAEGLTVNEGNAAEYLMHDQYVQFPGEIDQPTRHDRLGGVASAVVEALEAGSYDLAALADRLVAAAQARHVLLWSADPAVQAGWEAGGIAGALDEESLLVALINRGGNKLDRFLAMAGTIEVEELPGDDAGHRFTVEMELRNETPDGLPAYVAGPHPLVEAEAGEYVGLLSVTLPATASDVELAGGREALIASQDGANGLLVTEVRLLRGDRASVTVAFSMPEGTAVRVEPSARVPPVPWQGEGQEWDDNRQVTIAP